MPRFAMLPKRENEEIIQYPKCQTLFRWATTAISYCKVYEHFYNCFQKSIQFFYNNYFYLLYCVLCILSTHKSLYAYILNIF